jgi:thioesterase domain-containing protein/aryl carrier-like protein
MAAKAGRDVAVKSRGIELIAPELGLELLGKVVKAGVPQVTVLDAHWTDMFNLMGPRRPKLLDELAAEIEAAEGVSTASRVDRAFRQMILEADDAGRNALMGDYIQQELARIMGVAVESLVVDQPLSTFGLDSLLALELKNNLESRLVFTLPMAKLVEGPTIASLAAETVRLVVGVAGETVADRAKAGEQAEWTPLLALRATGSRPPLVLLPPLGGDVRCYAELVRQLGSDQPVYAFRLRGIDADLPPHSTMDDMIADYVSVLRELQPVGPYYLAGWSTGGIYTFALAEALELAGEEVALLALFDTPLPSICDGVDPDDETRFLCKLVNFANCFAGTNIRVDYDELLTMSPNEQFASALAEARRQGIVPIEASEAHIRRLVRVGGASLRAIQSYMPHSLHAPAHLFVPTKKGALSEVAERDIDESGDHGWRELVRQEIEMHEVSGDHFTMMLGDGGVQIARLLAELLDIQAAVRD